MFTMIVMESVSKNCDIYDYVEQAWCGIYGMAPTIQAQHVVAVTIPTIAVIFLTYLWYKKRSNSVTRGRSDPAGGGGTSKKRNRHRTSSNLSNGNVCNVASVTTMVSNGGEQENVTAFPEAMKSAMEKAMRDLETAAPIQEVCSDTEEGGDKEAPKAVADGNQQAYSEIASGTEVEDGTQTSSEESTATNTADVVEPVVQKQIKTDVRCEVTTSLKPEPINWADCISDSDCGDSTTSRSTTNSCCLLNQQPQQRAKNDKNNRNAGVSKEKSSTNEDLDVAMQKLESLRISDKSKQRKSTSNNNNAAKRQSPRAATSGDENVTADEECSVQCKSPTSSLTSPASKAKKRKARKRAKANKENNADNEDENGVPCKTQTDEVVCDEGATTKNACDSIKNCDVCVDRTDKNAKCAFRVRVPENERIFIDSRDDDSLRCSIKKTDDCDRKVVENNHHQENCDNERDSANHSPVDNILDSQSVQFSDAHSEGSSDSGKGCSEGAMSPSPQTPAGGSSISGDQNMILLFQFVIPQEHVGKLIGRHGQFINTIKGSSNTRIYIKKHPISFKKKICALEGTQQEINKALELIRNRFPEDAYPDVTLEEFPISLPIACPLRPELIQLDLVEGVNNDVVISSVVSAGHLFLQQPMHPTYQSLTFLNLSMNQVYNSPEAPLVLKPAKDNIVAAPAMDGWYRAQIVSVSENGESCEVRFLDYGGYLTLSTSCLRAVRADFLTLPFQAVECFLANVTPINGTWCEDAKLIVQGLTYGQILQAQVYDYTPEGIPLILLFAVQGTQVVLINQELVARGFAYPTVPNEGGIQSEEYYAYS